MDIPPDTPPDTPLPSSPGDVLAFWREAGPSRWFRKDAAFDERFRARFLHLHEAAAAGQLAGWAQTPEGALALLILLDQFPRNAFRGTDRMYATDERARVIASRAIAAGFDQAIEAQLRNFFYLPLMHSEVLADQERAVELTAALDEQSSWHARQHRDVIARFGRFPHRNPLLGRATTAEEQAFLDGGGFAG